MAENGGCIMVRNGKSSMASISLVLEGAAWLGMEGAAQLGMEEQHG